MELENSLRMINNAPDKGRDILHAVENLLWPSFSINLDDLSLQAEAIGYIS